jgi:hypothetical protein
MSTTTTGFYKRSRPRPDGTVGYSGYDHADTIAAVVAAYKRTRTTQYFILTDDSPDLANLRCTCGALLSEPAPDGKPEPGNRCQFVKRNGRAFVLGQHYICSWGTLLGALCTSGTVAEAGRKLTKAEAGGWKAVA